VTDPADRADLWVVDLDDPAAPSGETLLAGVSSDEAGRAAAMATELAGRRWLRGRYATRAVLCAATGVGPRDVVFERTGAGKPFVDGGPRFNVAHSGRLALVVVAARCEVGVDVEFVRPRLRERAILARVVGAAAERRWAGLAEDERTAAFFDEWVRFEAAVKCRGSTLAGSFGVDVAEGLTVARVDAGPGYAAAVALDGAGPPAPERFAWAG
jgi:4'-phosphopantetheinyl transferase